MTGKFTAGLAASILLLSAGTAPLFAKGGHGGGGGQAAAPAGGGGRGSSAAAAAAASGRSVGGMRYGGMRYNGMRYVGPRSGYDRTAGIRTANGKIIYPAVHGSGSGTSRRGNTASSHKSLGAKTSLTTAQSSHKGKGKGNNSNTAGRKTGAREGTAFSTAQNRSTGGEGGLNKAGNKQTGNVSFRKTGNRGGKLDPDGAARIRNWQGKKDNWAQAKNKHNDNCHHHHNHDWWHNHCVVVIWTDWGWWGWDDGWWYPAWGYDPYYRYDTYDQPIYDASGAAPEQVVADVQGELQRRGYFSYTVDGEMGPRTQNAIRRYQQDKRLPVTGTIDPATANSLGLMR